MPVSITKNNISTEQINTMVQRAFGCKAEQILELTEGFFNAAYKIKINQKEVILKIAPPPNTDILTSEINIMYSEVDSMRMVKNRTQVPIPEILFYDDSHTICESSYFFMEMLEGCSFSSCMEQMTPAEKDNIFYEAGKYTRMLNQITNTEFGYYCQKDKQSRDWFKVFHSMIQDTFSDAARKNIAIPVKKEQLLTMLEQDKAVFENVKQARLVHWDIWAGNVFVQNARVTGIIDFERCLWADELMEVGFRTYGYEKAFFDGYGITALTEEQTCRAKWYDIYLFLISCLECDYRRYDNRWAYDWGCDMLKKWVKIE